MVATLNITNKRTEPQDVDRRLELILYDTGFELLSNGVLVIDAGNVTDESKFRLRKSTTQLKTSNENIAEYEIVV